jgi:N-methylhydantoinase B
MFISNHPYISTPHQTCVVMVAPIHWRDSIVAWAGAGIHVADAGGPVPGQVSVGAQSIWEEAMPMPPLKLVEGGVIRKDIEHEYLIRSRTRLQNAIDMRAKIVAANAIKERVIELTERYGFETISQAMRQVIESSEARLRAILREVPDGSWEHTSFLDYYDHGRTEVHVCKLKMVKRGENLVFDFRGSSPQAPAVINATYAALQSSVVRMVMAIFGYAVGLCPGAVLRVIQIDAEPGTIVNCSWPAGACKGTTAATYSIMAAAATCLSKMLAASNLDDARITAAFKGHMHMAELVGTDQRGQVFGTVFVDGSLAQGNGARRGKDGIDTGGGMDPAVGIPNVETNEFRYPILYLYRREQRDTGGPGTFRGGVGLAAAFVPHDVGSISATLHGHGLNHPSAIGLSGGFPGGTNHVTIERGSNVLSLLERGIIPLEIGEAEGVKETPDSIGRSSLAPGDVYHIISCGGGGYGDPLERGAERVLDDVTKGLVSREWAEKVYGVVIRSSPPSVDREATERRRRAIRDERKRQSKSPVRSEQHAGRPAGAGELPLVKKIDEYLRVVSLGDKHYVRCRCGRILCPAEDHPYDYLASRERPCRELGPYTFSTPEFALRELFCPECFVLVDVQVVRNGGPSQ